MKIILTSILLLLAACALSNSLTQNCTLNRNIIYDNVDLEIFTDRRHGNKAYIAGCNRDFYHTVYFSKELKNENLGIDFIRAMLGGGEVEQAPKIIKVSAKFRYVGGVDRRIDILSVHSFQELPESR